MKKKILYGICMMTLVALVATSCKKKEETTKVTGEIALLDDGDGDRAYLNPVDKYTYWNEGDEIKIYNINDADPSKSSEAVYTVDQGHVTWSTFSPLDDAIGSSNLYHAFYPLEMAEEPLDKEGNYQDFEIPDYQPLVFNRTGAWTVGGTSLPMAATAGRDMKFNFKHIFGVCRFKFCCDTDPVANPEDPTADRMRYLKRIVVTDNKINLSGTVRLKPHKLDEQKLKDIMAAFKGGEELTDIDEYNTYVLSHTGIGLGYSAIGGGKSITYDFSSLNGGKGLQMQPITDPNNPTYVEVLVGLRPGALADGFVITATVGQFGKDDVDVQVLDWQNPEDRSKVVEPNKIKTFSFNLTNLMPQEQPQ